MEKQLLCSQKWADFKTPRIIIIMSTYSYWALCCCLTVLPCPSLDSGVLDTSLCFIDEDTEVQ